MSYRTATFKSVLHGIASLLGLDPDVNFTASQATALTRYINKWTRRGWEAFPWPDLTVTEQRFFRDTYNAAKTYALGDQVRDPVGGLYYQAAQGANTGHAVSVTAWWTPITITDSILYVDLEQYLATPIGDVFEVYSAEPRKTGTCRTIPFRIASGRIEFDTAAISSAGVSATDTGGGVWIEFRIRPSEFNSTVWSAATAYALGEVAYVAATGLCYRAILAGTNHAPASSPTYWTAEPMPYVLAPSILQAAYSDALKEDGQHDKARSERADAEDLLADEMDRINLQQRQTARSNIRTR